MRLKLILPVLVSIAFAAVPALADSYTFTIDHCTAGCGTAPFGTVNVTQDGANTVKLVVDLTAGDKFVNTGYPGSFAFSLWGDPTISVSDLSSGWSLKSTTAGNLHFDGFGDLDYALVCTACGNGGSNPLAGPLSFDVTATGLTPAAFSEPSTGNSQVYFVADIMGNTNQQDDSSDCDDPNQGNTGLVGATLKDSTDAPEPSSLLLLGTGTALVGFASLRRRKKA